MKLTIGTVHERPPYDTDFGPLNQFVYEATLEDGSTILVGQGTKGSNRPKEGEAIDFEYKTDSDGSNQMFVDEVWSAEAGENVFCNAIKRVWPNQCRGGGQGQHSPAPASNGHAAFSASAASPVSSRPAGLTAGELAVIMDMATSLVYQASASISGDKPDAAAFLESIRAVFATLFIGSDKLDLPAVARDAFDQPRQTLEDQPATDTAPEQPSDVPF